MTKKQTSEPETVRSDYALVQVTLTLAVETWLCDDQTNLVHDAAIETVLDRLIADNDHEIIVLNSKFEPLTLSKRVEA